MLPRDDWLLTRKRWSPNTRLPLGPSRGTIVRGIQHINLPFVRASHPAKEAGHFFQPPLHRLPHDLLLTLSGNGLHDMEQGKGKLREGNHCHEPQTYTQQHATDRGPNADGES